RARTIAELPKAQPSAVWMKPVSGPFSDLIWAPEIHFRAQRWYVDFAAAPSREIRDDLFQHRMYAISTDAANPLDGCWTQPERIETGIDSFCLDATTFTHGGRLYYVWAQKDPEIAGNSNLYIALMETPTRLSSKPVRLS